MVELDDLAVPRFSPEAQQLRDMMATMAADCPLDSAALHERASADIGLTDFGPSDYRERLDVYLAALRDIDGLDGAGVINFYGQLLQLLKNRLLLTDLLDRHPEIHDIELLPPVSIVGLPRSGTTHLHNLLSASGSFRTLPYWEAIEPFPLPSEAAAIGRDPRMQRMDVAVNVMNTMMPHFPLMHEMTTEHAHEEIALLANDFSTMYFETIADVPSWRDYYQAHDQSPHYAYMVTQLKALQFLRGGRRWLLKSPQHLEQLPVLNAALPGVVCVFTHRDPVPVALSMIAMITYSARMHRSPVPVEYLAHYWVERLETMLNAVVRDRDIIEHARSIDVPFDAIVDDGLGVCDAVFDVAGEPMSTTERTAMADYLDAHQRGRLGRVATDCAMFGLDPDDLRRRFAPYTERFLR